MLPDYSSVRAKRSNSKRKPCQAEQDLTADLPTRNATLKGILTRKKKPEMALLENEEFRSALLENSPNPIVVLNPDSSIRYVNPGFEKVTGYTAAETLGLKSPFPWWPPEKIQEYEADFSTRYAKKSDILERCYQRKDGQPIWIVIHVKPIQVNGAVKYYLAYWVDISERKKTENEIKQSREHLRRFSSYLQEKLEDERKYISQEIHDELGQLLTALRIDLSWLVKRLSPDLEALTQKTRSMITLLDETDKVVKKISAGLRPPILDDFGLPEALKWLVSQFHDRTGIQCSIAVREVMNLPLKLSVDAFRIVQEALANVARHSRATRVRVSAKLIAGYLVINIRDNGQGIDRSQIDSPFSYGLMDMQERALVLGGTWEIEGLKGKGTSITLKLPAGARQ
jgi:two-component system, NarL family, sensor histidine kinase UhpB